MTTLVIRHVKTSELPAQWAQQLKTLPDQTVTIRIETEMMGISDTTTSFVTDDPAFGIWQDYEAVKDVADFARNLRASRYNRDGSRNPDDDFRLRFEALKDLTPAERNVARELLDSLILEHTANRLSANTHHPQCALSR